MFENLSTDSDELIRTYLRQAANHYLDKDYAAALPILEFLVEAGSPAASFMLGRMHEKGRGVEESLDRAAELYEDACRGGVVHAQVN